MKLRCAMLFVLEGCSHERSLSSGELCIRCVLWEMSAWKHKFHFFGLPVFCGLCLYSYVIYEISMTFFHLRACMRETCMRDEMCVLWCLHEWSWDVWRSCAWGMFTWASLMSEAYMRALYQRFSWEMSAWVACVRLSCFCDACVTKNDSSWCIHSQFQQLLLCR